MTSTDYKIFCILFDTKNITKCPTFRKFLQGKLDLPIEEEVALSRVVERVVTYFCSAADKAAIKELIE